MSIASIAMGEHLPVVGQISPASYGTGEQTSAAIDMSRIRRIILVVQTGVLGTAATLDVKIQHSDTSGGSYTDIAGRSLTQIVKATGDNRLAILELRADQTTRRFVRVSATVGAAASIFGVVVLATGMRYSDAGENDIAAVIQIN